jgi:hypothetical protein
MLGKLRPRSAYDVCAVLALFVALGGTAYAVNTIGSADVINDSLLSEDIKNATVRGGDLAPGTISNTRIADGTLQSADVRNETLTGDDIKDDTVSGDDIWNDTLHGDDIENDTITAGDVRNNDLTGEDIKDKSGVDTCPYPATLRFGDICAGSDGNGRDWGQAFAYCATLGLRIPTLGEAKLLARNHDVPGVADDEFFWTDGWFLEPVSNGYQSQVWTVPDGPGDNHSWERPNNVDVDAVCVTTPSN